MTYPPPPLSDAQRDALIRQLTREVSERDETIRELRAELVAAHERNAELTREQLTEIPF